MGFVPEINYLVSCILNIEKQICESHRAEIKQEEIRAVTCIKSNSNYFFKYAKKHSHTISHIGPLLNELGELTNDVPEICNLLLNQYNSVFSIHAEKRISQIRKNFLTLKILMTMTYYLISL